MIGIKKLLVVLYKVVKLVLVSDLSELLSSPLSNEDKTFSPKSLVLGDPYKFTENVSLSTSKQLLVLFIFKIMLS